MNCERARLLMGVIDEIDEPTRRALRAHVNGCAHCFDEWLAEREFRYLLARRPPAPPPSRQQMERLLAVPRHDLTALRVRLMVGRAAPLLAGVLVLGGALLLATHLTGRARQPEPSQDSAQVLAIAPYGPSNGSPTVVARIRPPSASFPQPPRTTPPLRIAAAPASGTPATDAPVRPAPLPPPSATALPAPTWTMATHLGSAVTLPPPRPAAATSLPSPSEPSAPPNVPPTPPPTMAPSPTPPNAPVGPWTLDVRVSGEAPGDPPAGTVLIQIDAVASGEREWAPLYEVVVAFDADGVAVAHYRSSAAPPFAVSVIGLDRVPGFAPCPGQTSVRDVTTASFDADSRTEVAYRLCPAVGP